MKKIGKILEKILIVVMVIAQVVLPLPIVDYSVEALDLLETEKELLRSTLDSEKKNPDSYWSTTNAPLFYGATKITLKKGIIDHFDVLDTRFRIFAKDFEDGDLTPEITYTGSVDVNKVGTYSITYTVTDSHKNTTTLTVPVIVTDDEDAKINVERTLYTIPSTWNMGLAGFSRCNNGDRQILGIYLGQGQSVKARILSANNQITVSFFANDSEKESKMSIPNNGGWVTLTNSTDEDSAPVFLSSMLGKGDKDVNKVYKVELEYDETISALNYYHYKDDEAKFREDWKASKNTYGVVENEVLTVIVPFADIDRMVNHKLYGNSFKTLDQFLEYYQKVVDRMDELVGLDLNPEKITDQNVRTKYLVKANAHGGGAAYYAADHVGINNASISSFFQMNWGGLHELAHGYQGNLGKGTMGLGEVGNNILGHYIQIDKDIYFYSGDWLGALPATEVSRNANRESGGTWESNEVGTRLYMIVNLFDTFEGGETYAKIFSWYREKLNDGTLMVSANANQDIYALAIADIYHVNIIPYMEAWKLPINTITKDEIYSNDYPMVNILKDTVNDDSLNKVLTGENINRKYSLVQNDVLEKYNITGNVSISINIDDISSIKGKNLLIKDGNRIVKTVEITSKEVNIENVPVGNYYVQMPIDSNYKQDYLTIQIKENEKSNYTYAYTKVEDVIYDNYVYMRVKGRYFDTIAFQFTFTNNYKNVSVTYPNEPRMQGNEFIKIYDENGNVVLEEYANRKASDGYYYFNKKDAFNLELKPGYEIEIYYPSERIEFFSTLTNSTIKEYNMNANTTRYVITENGLKRQDMTDEALEELTYAQLKDYLISVIENYKKNVTEDELNNKITNFKKKSDVLAAFNQLREEDQVPYTELIERIKRGGAPVITPVKELEFKVNSQIDPYSLVTIYDNEDGAISTKEWNVKVTSNINTKKAGVYYVSYTVTDSDNNTTNAIIPIEIKSNLAANVTIDVPNTYDNGNPLLWTILSITSVIGIIACIIALEKRKRFN